MSVSDLNYKNKYLKYKNKYLNLQRQIGGVKHKDVGSQSLIAPVNAHSPLPHPVDNVANVDVPKPSMQTIPDDARLLILNYPNYSSFNKESRQIQKENGEISLKQKLGKTTLDGLFSTNDRIDIREPLNNREIYLLAELFVSFIDTPIFRESVIQFGFGRQYKQFISSNYISKNMPFSLIVLARALLIPTRSLEIEAFNYNRESDMHHFTIHFNDEPQRDNYVDFQLRFIFVCINIMKRQGNIHLTLDDIKFEEFKNSFNTVILGLKQNIPITKLTLKINDDGAKAIAEALKINTTLKLLNLGSGMIFREGAIAIAEALKINKTLTEMYLEINNIGDDGAKALAEALIVNETLLKLSLRDNFIRSDGIVAIANALIENKTLLYLDLGLLYSFEDQVGIIAIGNALEINRTLTELNLCHTINNESAKVIAEALKKNNTLTKLNLSENKIESDGGIAIADALKINTKLLELNLSENKIESDGGIAIADALKINTKLLELNLSYNQLSYNGVLPIINVLKTNNNTLSYINLRNNFISDSEKAPFIRYFRTNRRLTTLF
jgi:hypothetical protein